MTLSFFPLDRTPMFTHPHSDHFYMSSIDDPHPPQLPPASSPCPKPGQTRCYWTLLSSALEFLYIDPVLRGNLGPQADSIIGRRLLDFVHPDEHTSAQQDLRKVLESRTLHGSVTRVRFSRLGRLRARLGYMGVREKFADEDKVSFDKDYLACDLVINWVAEGLVLCFIHAVVDLSPQDNDEYNRTPWTNWCGTPELDNQEGERLYRSLFSFFPQAPQTLQSPVRVFQILRNTADRPHIVSWPAQGYTPAEYGKLAHGIQIGGANGSDAKTSCTRRYKAQQQLLTTDDASIRDVESIFIPHGHIIFACHKSIVQRQRGTPYSIYTHNAPAHSFYGQPEQNYPQSNYPPANVTVPSQVDSYSSMSNNNNPYPSYHHNSGHQHQPQHTMQSSFAVSGRNSPAGLRGTTSHSAYQQEQWTPPQLPDNPYVPGRPSSVEQCDRPSYSVEEVPPPRSRGPRSSPDPNGGPRGGHPPPGVLECAACKSTTSPEWRKGPSGKKDLCNACGLRYSRAKAKKEGISSSKRRRDGKSEESFDITTGLPPKRRSYVSGSYSDYAAESARDFGGSTGAGITPSPPQIYPNHHALQPHGVPANMYQYTSEARPSASMYMSPSQHSEHSSGYSHPQHHGNGHGYFAGGPTGTSEFGSSQSGSPAGITTPISSYERTGLHAEQRSGLPPNAYDAHGPDNTNVRP
ncbi:hypothetical protein M422DRAFT_26755 [Sphaerobolus stellatus SS14]|nr:hypothetical protein M422DRAFT_26755 [Sphaerobolus stellatus SS14]